MTAKLDSEVKKITDFIKSTFKDQGFKKGIVAVSGGIDSSLALSLSVKALGKDNIYTLQLPYKKHYSLSLSNLIINKLEIPRSHRLVINIGRPSDKLATKLNAKKHPLRFGNLLARVRMACLFDQAKRLNALVIGTENKSEHLLGYFTRFGDQGSDIEPIIHLYKTKVIKLAQSLSIPKPIIKAFPSANLWPNQTDEKELGFSYQSADPILELFCDKKLNNSQIVKKGFDTKLVKAVISRVKSNQFKHLTPYAL